MPAAYYIHPEFGCLCPSPGARRELRVAVVSILFGIAIGAAIVTVGTGHAVETDGVSSNAYVRTSSSYPFLPGAGGPTPLFENADKPGPLPREGGLYRDLDDRDWGDNAQRFTHLTRVAAKIAVGEVIPGWRADVVHCNDWHTGLLPLQLSDGGGSRPATLFTIHNLAFQGLFPERTLASLRLPNDLFTPDGIEFHGQISFLKAGIRYSDRLATVSPSYAREILTPEFGCGLDGLLRARASELNGITNGIDDQLWNPAADPHVPAGFSVKSHTGVGTTTPWRAT